MRRFLFMSIAALGLVRAPVSSALPGRGAGPAGAGEDEYVPLRRLASNCGLKVYPGKGDRVSLRSRWSRLEFEGDSRRTRLNGVTVWLHRPVLKVRGHWGVARADWEAVVDPVLRSRTRQRDAGYRVVMLDPGHGGRDRGATGKRSVEEKRVVLDVAKRVRAHLAQDGTKVYLTRDGDRFIELEERSRLAVRRKADLFVSIHINSAANTDARGLETYVLSAAGFPSTAETAAPRTRPRAHAANGHDAANAVLGYHLQRRLLASPGGEDRGVKRSRFAVLRNSPCPAALVECGFVSNAVEENLMLDAAHRERIALGIYNGLTDYLNAVRKARLSE